MAKTDFVNTANDGDKVDLTNLSYTYAQTANKWKAGSKQTIIDISTLSAGTPTVYSTAGTFTWTKPGSGTAVVFECWGGGGVGGGSSWDWGGGGGGGGGYARIGVAFGDVGATETVVVGSAGGTSSVGTWVSATGGNNGGSTGGAGGSGGSGSGTTAAADVVVEDSAETIEFFSGTRPSGPFTYQVWSESGGAGGFTAGAAGASTTWAGAGGGGGGGHGVGGFPPTAGGTSTFGGNGGAGGATTGGAETGVAGSAPGGGSGGGAQGGGGGAGGLGRVRITVYT